MALAEQRRSNLQSMGARCARTCRKLIHILLRSRLVLGDVNADCVKATADAIAGAGGCVCNGRFDRQPPHTPSQGGCLEAMRCP